MGSLREGARAGLVAGSLYSALVSAFSIFILASSFRVRAEILYRGQPMIEVLNPFRPEAITAITITGLSPIVMGLIIGILFGKSIESLPGKTTNIKSINLGVWMFASQILTNLINLDMGLNYYVMNMFASVPFSLLYGALLGVLYERFTR